MVNGFVLIQYLYVMNSEFKGVTAARGQLIGCSQYGGQCRQSLGLAIQTLGEREEWGNLETLLGE